MSLICNYSSKLQKAENSNFFLLVAIEDLVGLAVLSSEDQITEQVQRDEPIPQTADRNGGCLIEGRHSRK